ncbi:putative metallo-dependent phosphatase [Lanmaoa asiatica]|nr:putative metallo-dependent phosphatase [Lanmaoa asiatica]
MHRPLDDLSASPSLFLARRVYAWTQSSDPIPSTQQSPADIRIVCIADTHNTHRTQPPLPPGDILLHAGDLTRSGTLPELCDALTWLSVQPHPIKMFIAGNHDGALAEPETRAYVREAYPALTYLENDVVEVTVRRRTLRIYGSPYTPQYGAWAFQYPRFRPSNPRFSSALLPVVDTHHPSVALWSRIPPQIDVLLTHGPPLGHLDGGAGCTALLSALWRVRPRLHVFGHIHAARGTERVSWDDVQPAFEAVCVCTDSNAGAGVRWVQFVQLLWRAVTAKLTAWWWGRPARRMWGRETVLVNAASVGDESCIREEDNERRGAIVVDVDLAS